MDHDIFGLFPIPVAQYRCDAITPRVEAFVEETLKELRPNFSNRVTVNDAVLEEPAMAEVKEFCIVSLRHYASEVMSVNDGACEPTQSWLTATRKGEWHQRHLHRNSVWSGVLYLEVGEGDAIQFHCPNPNGRMGGFHLPHFSHNPHNVEVCPIAAKKHHLLIFPSHVEHSVFASHREWRVSLSFNTFPTRWFGDPSWLTSSAREHGVDLSNLRPHDPGDQ